MALLRSLYERLLDAGSSTDEVVRLLIDAATDPQIRAGTAGLARYRQLGLVPGDDEHLQALVELYALSRVSDYLLLSFQGRDDEAPPRPAILESTYVSFFQALGFRPFRKDVYSPFFHEIVEVTEDATSRLGIRIERQFWPGLLFGSLLFARAGVRVHCDPSVARKEHAETTLLCFTHRRHRRQAADRSLGWGRNSQWSTTFRRDYLDGDRFRFNVDGEVDISGSEPRVLKGIEDYDGELPIELRQELLVNRCFVSQAYPWSNDEDWPHRDTLTVRRDDPLVSP